MNVKRLALKVELRIFATRLTIESRDERTLSIRGGQQAAIDMATRYLRENTTSQGRALSRGRTLQHRLAAADRLARKFKGKVIARTKIVAALRDGWRTLLSENLTPDDLDKRELYYWTWPGIQVVIKSDNHDPVSCGGPIYPGAFDARRPSFLVIFQPRKRNTKIKWEEITEIRFTYFEPRAK